MKKILSGIALMAALGVKADGHLNLTASIPSLPNNEVVRLYGLNSKFLDSTTISNHGFSFNSDIKKGDVFIIQVGNDMDQHKGMVMYMEPGKLSITGSGPYFEGATFSGGSFIREYKEVERMMYDSVNFKGASTLDEEMAAAQAAGDMDKFKELANLNAVYANKRLELAKNWVDAHPNSPISAFVINIFMEGHVSQSVVRDYVAKLGPDAIKNFIAEKLLAHTNLNNATVIGMQAPLFAEPDADGHTVALSDLKGKYVLVDFWASWCHPCRELTPKLKALYEKYKDKNFTILSVSLDTDKDKWLKAVAADHMTWPQVSDLKQENSAAVLYHVMAIPASFLVDPNGKIVSYAPDEETMEKFLNK